MLRKELEAKIEQQNGQLRVCFASWIPLRDLLTFGQDYDELIKKLQAELMLSRKEMEATNQLFTETQARAMQEAQVSI